MSFDAAHTIESIQEGTKEVAETAHVKTSEFHEKYISKVVAIDRTNPIALDCLREMGESESDINRLVEEGMNLGDELFD